GREVGPISPGVAGEEGQALDQDVGPDEEVRERRGPLAAALPVGREGAGRRPSGAVRECQPPYTGFGKGLLEQRFSFEPEAQLRIDDRVDRERATLGRARERFLGPAPPSRVPGPEIDEDIRVDGDHRSPPRAMAMSRSVVSLRFHEAPLSRSTMARPRRCRSARTILTPSFSRKKATSSPTFQPNASLSSLGTVTCPFTVMVLVFTDASITSQVLPGQLLPPAPRATWVRTGARPPVPRSRRGHPRGGIRRGAVSVSDRQDRQALPEDAALRTIVEGVESATGERFFASLVEHLAVALGVQYAFVSELSQDRQRFRTLALWGRGRLLDNLEFPVAGTPCEAVLNGEMSHHPDRLQERFPADRGLVDWGVHSYCGVPLLDAGGTVVGHLAILDDQRMPDGTRGLAVMRIFAARARAEIERVQTEAELRAGEERLRHVIASASDGILSYGDDLRIQLFNAAAERILRCPAAAAIGQSVERFAMPEGLERVRRAIERFK